LGKVHLEDQDTADDLKLFFILKKEEKMPLFIIMKMIAKVTMFVYFLNYRKKKGNVNYLK